MNDAHSHGHLCRGPLHLIQAFAVDWHELTWLRVSVDACVSRASFVVRSACSSLYSPYFLARFAVVVRFRAA